MDLISREAAIDIVNRYNQSHMILKGKPIVGAASMVIEMEDLPSAQPEQRWIPCSERLPSLGTDVLISHVGSIYVDHLAWDDGDLMFFNACLYLPDEIRNIAWMPLPEPWKGEEE